MIQEQHYVRSIDTQVEGDLLELHSQLLKDLNARCSGQHLFSDRRQRDAMIKWRIRLEQFIETADVTYVTQHIPRNINAVWWITQSVYSAVNSRRKVR